MRSFLLSSLLVVGSAQVAWASFDLMYIPSPSTNRVIRYDPVNRVQLGSFNAPGASSVFAGGERTGAVQINAGLYRYDMFTNTNMGHLPFIGQSFDPQSNRILSVTPSSLQRLDLVSGSITALNLAGASSLIRANAVAPGLVGAFSLNAGVLGFRFHDATTGALITNGTFGGTQTLTRFSGAVVTVNRQGARVMTMVALDSVAGWRLYRVSINGLSVSSNLTNLTGFSPAHSVALAPAHAGYYVVGTDGTSTTSTRFTAFDDDSSGFQYDTWTEPFVSASTANNYSVGMVVAPEPGTMAALGLGALAMLRRRRRAK